MAPALAIAGGQALYGLGQSIFGGIARNKALKKLEGLQTPTYTPNQSIGDFYETAKNRFNVNPFESAEYKIAQTNADRAAANSINSLQDRRGALAAISGINAGQNNAMLKAGTMATNEQNQRFGVLGNATNMKANDDKTAFQYNKVAPYEKQYNLLAMKAGAASNTVNSGTQNIFGGLSNAATMMSAMPSASVRAKVPANATKYFSPFVNLDHPGWNNADLLYNHTKRPRPSWE